MKEYLNEEHYENVKKRIKTIALIILVFGILVGGSLIATGIKKSNSFENVNEKVTIEDMQKEVDDLKSELVSLNAKQNQEFMKNQFSEEYYRLNNEIDTKQKKINELESEIWKNKSGYSSINDSISKSEYRVYYVLGAFIIIVSCMISGSIYMFSKRREMMAFTVQQVMPIAQEGMEKMAPTLGKTSAKIAKEMMPTYKEIAKEAAPIYGEIAKEVSKGIKKGLKEAKSDKKQAK